MLLKLWSLFSGTTAIHLSINFTKISFFILFGNFLCTFNTGLGHDYVQFNRRIWSLSFYFLRNVFFPLRDKTVSKVTCEAIRVLHNLPLLFLVYRYHRDTVQKHRNVTYLDAWFVLRYFRFLSKSSALSFQVNKRWTYPSEKHAHLYLRAPSAPLIFQSINLMFHAIKFTKGFFCTDQQNEAFCIVASKKSKKEVVCLAGWSEGPTG